jgi:tRNA 2-selenouridine synthase SelU
MAGPSTADLFAALRDASAPLSTDDMEAFASGVKLDLAAGGAECRAEVEDLVRASVACSDADRAAEALIVDVRSPGEFARGHVPGALNVPLFTDDERAKVGTAFAKQGRGVALVLGMKAVRPKLERLVHEVVRLAEAKEAEPGRASARAPLVVYVHCWRGGMRSSSLTWLLLHAAPPGSLDARVVRGGYKAFRRFVLTRWHTPASLTRSSSSSSMASSASTSSSMFEDCSNAAKPEKRGEAPRAAAVRRRRAHGRGENSRAARVARRRRARDRLGGHRRAQRLGVRLGRATARAAHQRALRQPRRHALGRAHDGGARVRRRLRRLRRRPAWIFIEDEGPHVGKCSVDPGLFARMRHAPLVVNVVAPRATRLRTLVEDYAAETHRADPAWRGAMDESVGKLRKRLGNQRADALRGALREGDFAAVADGLLEYYDGLYDKHLGSKRVEKRERQAARRQGARRRERRRRERRRRGDGGRRRRARRPSRPTLEQAARAGEVVECRARARWASATATGDIRTAWTSTRWCGTSLTTVAAFEAEEAERGSAGGSE